VQSDTSIVVNEPVSPFNPINQQVYEILPEPKEISNKTEIERDLVRREVSNDRQVPELFDMSDDNYNQNEILNERILVEEKLESVDNEISSNVISQEDLFIQNIKTKLFKKYRFKTFISSLAKNDIFCNIDRPSGEQWSKAMISLVKTNVLSNVSTGVALKYKFNLQSEDSSKFLTYDYTIKSINRSLNKIPTKKLSASKLRHQIKNTIRPKINDWEEYLNSLVEEGYYRTIEESSIISYTLL
jgi:hypothetical protein